MIVPAPDRAAARATRSHETTRLFVLVTEATDADERHDLVNQVIVMNLGVARAMAWRFRGRGIPDEDLEQVAFTALTRAAQRFDPAQDRDFLAYAVPTMSGELKRHFRDLGWTVRPPRRIQEIQSRVINAYKIGREAGYQPSASRLADELCLPEADVSEALRTDGCFRPASLDGPVHHGGPVTVGETLVSEDSSAIEAVEARQLLGPALDLLTERDRTVLHLRFVEEKTQREIGEEIGVSQMQVSRLLRRILDGLRDQIEVAA